MEDKKNDGISKKVWMMKKKIMGQNKVWKIKKRCCFKESMDDEKKIMGLNEVWKIKKNDGISKKVWMMKK